ncbi:MAG: serine hydrolase [Dysgonomonas sp.]|nr:serine hydrolase [Dysgonomonas sp.]
MRNILILCLFALLANTSCNEQKKTEKSELGDYLDLCEELNLFSGSVLIMEKGEKIFEGSYGYKNQAEGEKNTNDSKYRAYSITKAFTATVILQLEEEGKLFLTDKLSKFYPDFPKGDSITITNLLGHTSGIPNETDENKTVDEETFMKYISAKPFDFSPNSAWGYSNSNYYILGYIIKHITGQDYDKEIEQRILKPLGMNNSGFHFNDLKDANKTTGYSFLSKDNATGALLYRRDHPYAAGAMYSTTADLYKFSEAIKNNILLKKETMDKASVPQQGSHYGLGFQLDSILDKAQIGHTGGGPGYRSGLYRIIEDDITIVLFSNNQSIPNAVFQRIFKIALKKPYTLPMKSPIAMDKLQRYEGVYSDSKSEFYIKADDGVLTFNEKGYGKNILLPMSDTLFQLSEELTLAFRQDSLIINFPDGSVKRSKKTDKPFIWGIIGDATPNGWDGQDVPLELDATAPHVFSLRKFKLKKGGFQFRQNSDWSNSLSLSANGDLIPSGYNIEVEEGTYDITLDMTNRLNPKYKIRKIDDK